MPATLNGTDCAASSAGSATLVQELQAIITTQVQQEIRNAFTNMQSTGYPAPFFRPQDPAPAENPGADEFGLVEQSLKDPLGLGLMGEDGWDPSLSVFAMERSIHNRTRIASASGSSVSYSPDLPPTCAPVSPDSVFVSHDVSIHPIDRMIQGPDADQPIYKDTKPFDLHDF